MKTAWLAILILAPAAAGAQTMLVLHENQAGGACYPAPLGQDVLVTLPAQAGTGYRWAVRGGDGLAQAGDLVVGRPAGGGMVVGGPEMQTLRVHPTEPGRHRLTVGYARPFETGVAPVRTLTFCLLTPAR